MPYLSTKRSCAPHDDEGGETYDAEGNVCSSLSKEDKWFIIGASASCAIVLGILGLILLRRWKRSRASDRMLNMSTRADAPLVTRYPSNDWHSTRSVEVDSPYIEYSPSLGSDHSHMPILSADGHLLSPNPSDDNRLYRPLPLAPGRLEEYNDVGECIYAEQDIGQERLYR